MISSTQNKEMSSGYDEMEAEVDAEEIQEAAEANTIFAMYCENFAILAKFSLCSFFR